MANERRPLRSLVSGRGNSEKDIREKMASEADAVWIDCEDSLHPTERVESLKMCRRMIEEYGGQGRVVFARISGMSTGETGYDLEALVCPQLHGVFLAKPQGPRDVMELDALLDHFEQKNGVPVGHTFINPLMESLTAIDAAYELGMASKRVEYMGGAVANGGDQAAAVGYHWTPEGDETLYIRSSVLIKAKRAGVLYPLGAGLPQDPEQIRTIARENRNIGYTGMLCTAAIAPIVNEIFSPSPQEIEEWQGIVAALDEADRQGKSRADYKGMFLDPAHAKNARLQLETARKLGVLKD